MSYLAEWVPHLARLLLRSWSGLVAGIGTTTLGVVVTVASVLVPYLLVTGRRIRWWDTREVWRASKEAFKPSGIFTVSIWLLLFGYFVAETIYRDHTELVRRLAESDNRIERLNREIQTLKRPAVQSQPASNWRDQTPRGTFSFELLKHVVPGARATVPKGINDRGDIVGFYHRDDGQTRWFLLLTGADVQTIEHPKAQEGSTILRGINSKRELVGYFQDAVIGPQRRPVAHGFVRRADHQFETFDCFGSPYTEAIAINDRGQIVGYAEDETRADQAFIRDSRGTALAGGSNRRNLISLGEQLVSIIRARSSAYGISRRSANGHSSDEWMGNS